MMIDHDNGKIYEVSANLIRLLNILGMEDVKEVKDL